MSATIFLKLLLFLAVFELASAIAGHRVYGTRFSLALPRITTADGVVSTDTKSIGSLVMMTEEERSKVKILYPEHYIDANRGYKTVEKNLRRYKAKEVFIPKMYLFESKSSTGVYNTVKITSTSPIRVVLNRYNNKNQDSANMHNVIPVGSCLTSYYVSTGHGHAFLMVMTFDFTVNIRVTFPETGQKFKFLCHKETQTWCEDDSEVILTLTKNKAWYVEQEPGVGFLNTLIETDKPVFVIAGNKDLGATGRFLDDSVVTSIYPTAAWGKEYVIPRMVIFDWKVRNLVLQFNTKRLPFKFQTFNGVNYSSEVISSFDSYFTIRNTRGFYVLTADVPFGLYQIFGLQGQNSKKDDCVATIVNLIPTEQWSNGVVLVKLQDNHHYIYTLYTTAHLKKREYRMTGSPRNSIIWLSRNITYNGQTYYSALLELKDERITFVAKDPLAKVIVYQFKLSAHHTSCSCTAVDFYQATIHQLNCKKTKNNIVANDGVDNDCDGRVDEEIEDRKDNDGDGEVDEDLVEKNRKSTWTDWTSAGHFSCYGVRTPLVVRACRKTRYGYDCEGLNHKCIPWPACPKSCSRKPITFLAVCQEGCQLCEKNFAVCAKCKAGYYDDLYCLRPCPDGWPSQGCELPLEAYPRKRWIPRPKKKIDAWVGNTTDSTEPPAVEKETKSDEGSFGLVSLVVLILLSLLAAVGLIVLLCRKRPVIVEQTEVVEEEKVEEVQSPQDESSVDTTSDWQSELSDYSVAESEV